MGTAPARLNWMRREAVALHVDAGAELQEVPRIPVQVGLVVLERVVRRRWAQTDLVENPIVGIGKAGVAPVHLRHAVEQRTVVVREALNVELVPDQKRIHRLTEVRLRVAGESVEVHLVGDLLVELQRHLVHARMILVVALLAANVDVVKGAADDLIEVLAGDERGAGGHARLWRRRGRCRRCAAVERRRAGVLDDAGEHRDLRNAARALGVVR